MSISKKEALITILIERLADIRIPRILTIKERVDNGSTLGEEDIHFLTEVLSDFKQNRHLLNESEELNELAAQFIHLNNVVTNKALENEQQST